MNRIVIAMIAALLWSAFMFGAGWAWRGDRAEAADARQQTATATAAVQQVNDTRATEQSQALQMADIGAKHEEDRTAAEAVPAAVAADLRAGNLRLRQEWAGCETQRLSDAAASAVERDAATERREQLAGEIVRIGRDADDQLRACQAVIAADRGA